MSYDKLIDTKIDKEVRLFLSELRKLKPAKADQAEKNWEDYKPHIKKCENKQEMALMLMTFFKRTLKSAKSAEPKKFSQFRYKSVGRLMNSLFALRINKNQVGDYVKHLHRIKAEAGEEQYDKEQFMKEYNAAEKKKRISLGQMRERLNPAEQRAGFDWERFAAQGAIVSIGLLVLVKLLRWVF
ncbi:MAG: hypothetical protein GOU99_00340 [Candidatus Altiarchaeota archaeon]|nr:hypothetical protein [Candidatus Altiarchaeota archaeon]